uniref:(California timema) hypothetical protein n=1 Tax=Timema californicum TaxID=61474 RepID=A0A7R9P6T0_TIMCA|nr:unnamed protein product [Timema californicum]
MQNWIVSPNCIPLSHNKLSITPGDFALGARWGQNVVPTSHVA